MGIFDFFRGGVAEDSSRPSAMQRVEPILAPASAVAPRAEVGSSQTFTGLDDPRLLEFIRTGGGEAFGGYQLRNMAVLRCVSLICGTVGMLPISLIDAGDSKRVVKEHAGHRLLKVKPNPWQTPLEFKRQMELAMCRHGNAYARVVRTGRMPIALVPLDSTAMDAELGDDWRMLYHYASPKHGRVTLTQDEVFHVRDLSVDGVSGLSRMKLANEAISLAQAVEKAASRLFTTGNMAGGAIEVPNALSDTAYSRMRTSLDTDFAGASSMARWLLLEEGAKASKFSSTAKDAQQVESRNAQIEEIARLWGVPRPLLMMDDTSWGSGIEQLGIFFIQYAMLERFTNWEQAAARSLLSDSELEQYQFKFNVRALMRGTLKDQAEFYAKALGAGGHAPWMKQNEIRELEDYPRVDDPNADLLRNPMTQKGKTDEPPATA